MYTHTRAIVLRSIRYSDADLIAKCYTASDGLKSYILKGILKSKKGKIKASLFQPFNQLDLVARHKNKGGLEYLKEAKLSAVTPSIHTEIQKASIALFLAEVLQGAIQEEEQNTPLFDFLERSIQWLEAHGNYANFHLLFLVKLTQYLGIHPHYQPENAAPFFNLRQGYFEEEESDNYSVSGPNCELLKKLLETSWEEIDHLKLNQERRQGFLNFIISYYQIQLQGFKEPKSLEVLYQLFS